jgi:D-alanyl-D-alanine carboxypeptidase (penicillin-binding protein 5/6)
VRRAACLLAALAALALAPTAAAKPAPPPSLDARAWLLVDAADGERLAARAATRPVAIASATKLMTAHLALDELPLERRLEAPAYQALPAESILGLRAGERISVRDLLYALLLESANDAAVTIAEGVAGSVPAFVREMNREAEALGLERTHYDNPIGLDSLSNRSTAADLVELTLRLRGNRLFRRVVDTAEATVQTDQRSLTVANRNTLVLRVPWINGVKTGHTLDAGYVLVGSGTRKETTLVSVVLGAPSESARDADTLELLDWGFSLYRPRTAVREGEVVAVPELRYQGETLDLVARSALRVSVRRGEQVATEVSAPEEVEGPIERGERLGAVEVTVDGRAAGSVPLIAARSAPEATFIERALDALPHPAILALIGAGVIVIGVMGARRGRGAPRSAEERMQSHEDRVRGREGPSP